MSLPKHINLAGCVPDPHGRANHIYHAKTDEVLHVSPELAATVRKINQKAAEKTVSKKGSALVGEEETETGLTLSEEATAPTLEEQEGEAAPDRAELLAMADSLELTVLEDISDADLLALVEAAVQD